MSPLAQPRYVGNPKHKRGRNRGRRGSYCPGDLDEKKAQALLDASLHAADGPASKRYATDGKCAFCAQCHDRAKDEWHGYPISWNEVPPSVRWAWVRDGTIQSRTLRARSGPS
jgi:hypothetical protein